MNSHWFREHYSLSIPTLVVGILLLLWSLIIILIPLTLPPNTVDLGENGTNMPGEHRNITSKMPPLQRFVYSFGDATCHQKSSRSFHINGNQMPLCSRCTSIYLGMALGTLFLAFFKVDIKLWHFVVFLLPMAIDGTGQTILGLWESTNLRRVITGSLAGLVTGAALGYIINEIYGMLRYRASSDTEEGQ